MFESEPSDEDFAAISSPPLVIRALARTLLNSARSGSEGRLAEDTEAVAKAAAKVLRAPVRRGLRNLIGRILQRPEVRAGQVSVKDIERLLNENEALLTWIDEGWVIDPSQVPSPQMRRGVIAASQPMAVLNTVGDLQDWLGLRPEELDWFRAIWRADGSPEKAAKLSHYHYEWIPKSSGGLRLLEAPKRRLKEIQRTIHDEILRHAAVHDAAHAYRTGRSMATGLAPHVGQAVVWHLDLCSFFWSIGSGRVRRLFRGLGYPENVAEALTSLCTTRCPEAVLAKASLPELERQQLRGRHLPQGAPTSPALSNLCVHRLDCRLTALARRWGAVYTRYADDLVFSGDSRFRRGLPRFRTVVLAILIDEGFQIRRRKTRVLRSGEQQKVGGLVLNEKLSVPKREYDALRATLHNCCRRGPEQENRDGHPHFREHLLGRIGWIETFSRERGRKLRELFAAIMWPTDVDAD